MKAALLVGIDEYGDDSLIGCVDDASRMSDVLSTHANGCPNFKCLKRSAPAGTSNTVTSETLNDDLQEIIKNEPDSLLFYFSGHGDKDDLGTLLVAQEGFYPLRDLIARANMALENHHVKKEVVIILDCCFSGDAGHSPFVSGNTAVLAEGLTILAGTRAGQTGMATTRGSVFTNLLVEALSGGAADLLGSVHLSSAYAFVEKRLGAFDQRPMFKCNVSEYTDLRICDELIDRDILRKITEYFPESTKEYRLGPSYEEDKRDVEDGEETRNPEHEKIFCHFRKYASLGLLVPVGEEYLYHAAVRSKSCKLTSLGRSYWQLVHEQRV